MAQPRLLCVLSKGTRIREGLDAFLRAHNVRTGTIGGIGAVGQADIGFYDLAAKEYRRKEVPEITELVSFLGNITWVDEAPFIHAHVVLGRPDFTLLGGHFFDARIAITGEFTIHPHPQEATRAHDPTIGLSLIVPPAQQP